MPRMTIIDVDGNVVEVTTNEQVEAQIDRIEEEMEKLVSDLESKDNIAGERALAKYDLLASRLNAIIGRLDDWNKVLEEETYAERIAIAKSIRERRRLG